MFIVVLDKAKIYFVHDTENEMMTTAKLMTARAKVMLEVKKMT